MIFSLKLCQNDLIKRLRWFVSEKCMHQLPENMFLPRHFRSFQNKIISVVKEKKILGPTTTFLDFKNSDIFIQILPKRPYQMPVVARFRDTYARTSWKYVSTESKIRSSQKLHKIFFIFHFSVFRFQKQWYFHSNSAKTTLSDTCVGSFQRHVCTDFQKICFYWA